MVTESLLDVIAWLTFSKLSRELLKSLNNSGKRVDIELLSAIYLDAFIIYLTIS
jgi:hypothetical protein